MTWNDEQKQCLVRMGLSTINYGFEFVSMNDTLIFTSDSERAFLGTLFTIQNGLGMT